MTVIIPKWWPNRSNSEFISQKITIGTFRNLALPVKSYCLFTEPAHLHIAGTLIQNLNLEFEILCLDLPGHGFTRALVRQKSN